MTPAQEQAARITGALWGAVTATGVISAGDWRHYPGAADPALLASLPLPAPGDQPVALTDGTGREFQRVRDPRLLDFARGWWPRTLAWEDIGHGDPGHWAALACSHLARLSGSALPVICTAYASAHGDETMGAHRDAWYGAVIQVAGAKDWLIGDGVLGPGLGPDARITASPGDILLLPKGTPHAVTTPQDPGWSVHLAFAIRTGDGGR